MLFLATNDDGYDAQGLKLLAESLEPLGEVFIAAPDREQSAKSHSLTLDDPLRITKIRENYYSISGTPTDCVLLARYGLLKRKPDYVISGINHGNNMGDDVTYSGTVAAAMEGLLLGIPSIAISHANKNGNDFSEHREILKKLFAQLFKQKFPDDTFLNINIPASENNEVKGVRITNLGRRTFSDNVIKGTDPKGRPLYWIGAESPYWQGDGKADFKAIQEGFISITPVHLDLTNYDAIGTIENWKFDL